METPNNAQSNSTQDPQQTNQAASAGPTWKDKFMSGLSKFGSFAGATLILVGAGAALAAGGVLGTRIGTEAMDRMTGRPAGKK